MIEIGPDLGSGDQTFYIGLNSENFEYIFV